MRTGHQAARETKVLRCFINQALPPRPLLPGQGSLQDGRRGIGHRRGKEKQYESQPRRPAQPAATPGQSSGVHFLAWQAGALSTFQQGTCSGGGFTPMKFGEPPANATKHTSGRRARVLLLCTRCATRLAKLLLALPLPSDFSRWPSS